MGERSVCVRACVCVCRGRDTHMSWMTHQPGPLRLSGTNAAYVPLSTPCLPLKVPLHSTRSFCHGGITTMDHTSHCSTDSITGITSGGTSCTRKLYIFTGAEPVKTFSRNSLFEQCCVLILLRSPNCCGIYRTEWVKVKTSKYSCSWRTLTPPWEHYSSGADK